MKLFWLAITLLIGLTAIVVLVPAGQATPDMAALETSLAAPAPLPDSLTPGQLPGPVTGAAERAETPAPIPDAEKDPVPAPTTGGPAPTNNQPASPASASAAAPASDPTAVFENVVPAKSESQSDGTTLLDGRFTIRGSGIESDPYVVPWELLLSASETYQPRRGKNRLPERITMLHEKHVRITGYVAFPIVAASQDEMLSMRNMWDGCCIGLPPTAYDAIEVRLTEPATGDDRFAAYGTVEGKFLVDPYLKGNWLLGLYMMENATLAASGDMMRDPSLHSSGSGSGVFPGMP